MKNKNNISKMIIIAVFAIVVILSAVITDRTTPRDEYADVEFAEISANEFKDLFEEAEERFIYIGRPTCPYCVESEPWSKRISKELNKEIYYINIDEETDEALTELEELTDGIYRGSTPLFLIVKNGEVLDYLEGAGSYDNLNNFFSKSE